MTCSREQVFEALFAFLSPLQAPAGSLPPYPAAAPFLTVSRRATLPGQGFGALDWGLTPALIMVEMPEHYERPQTGLPIRHWPVDLYVIFVNTNRDLNGSAVLNPLLDVVEAALQPNDPVSHFLKLLQLGPGFSANPLAYVEGVPLKNNGNQNADGRGGALMVVDIVVP